MIQVSFIIVNYNSSQFVEKLINSINQIVKTVEYEIVIWDNASPEKQSFSEADNLFVHWGKENLGFGDGCNKAVVKSRYKYLVFINPDAELISENLYEMCLILNEKSIGIIGCIHKTTDGSIENSIKSYPSISNSLLKLIHLNYFSDQLNYFKLKKATEFTTEVVSGSFILINREIFDKVGGFDSEFFMYAEESDLCKRISDLGMKILFSPSTVILHHGSKSTPNLFFHINNIHVSECLYVKKHHSYFYYILFKFINLLNKFFRGITFLFFYCFTFNGFILKKSKAFLIVSIKNINKSSYIIPSKVN